MSGEVKPIQWSELSCPNHFGVETQCCKELTAAKAETEEQARLLGMSGSREAKLLAKIESLEKRLEASEKVAEVLRRYSNRTDIAHEVGVVDALSEWERLK